MRVAIAAAVVLSSLVGSAGCAARDARPATPMQHRSEPSSNTSEPAAGGQSRPSEPRYREMTWSEYYAKVRERAAQRGVAVIWINPPHVRRARAQTRAAD